MMKNWMVWLLLPLLVALAAWGIWDNQKRNAPVAPPPVSSGRTPGVQEVETKAAKKEGLNSPRVKERIKAVEDLAKKKDEAAKAKLLNVLAHEEHPEVKARLIEELGHNFRFDPQVIAALTRCMAESEKPEVRGAADEALGTINEMGKAAVPEVRKLLKDGAHRAAALEVLGRIGPAAGETVEEVGAYLESPKTAERLAAITALRRIGLAAKAVLGDETKGIVKAAADEDARIRECAAQCFKRIGEAAKTAAVKAALEKLKADKEAPVRKAAEAAWQKLYEE
jgi:HEAT repeat protein